MKKMPLSLALQGGGSHGAFTWGVLDRLLDESSLRIDAVSGASAGAMNAALLVHGLARGGREAAREDLRQFWERLSIQLPQNFLSVLADGKPDPTMQAMLFLTRFFSPTELNPLGHNPLRDILLRIIDFSRLQHSRVRLFVAATQVDTGMLKVFRNRQMSVEVLLASACLPSLHHAVMIDGEAYWDGGLTANPPIFPLVHQAAAKDVLVVMLNPLRWPQRPGSADEITSRVAEISFGSALYTELQGLALAQREARRSLFAVGRMERRLRNLHVHLINAEETTRELPSASKLNTQLAFISMLFDAGRQRAGQWLAENRAALGRHGTLNLARLLA